MFKYALLLNGEMVLLIYALLVLMDVKLVMQLDTLLVQNVILILMDQLNTTNKLEKINVLQIV